MKIISLRKKNPTDVTNLDKCHQTCQFLKNIALSYSYKATICERFCCPGLIKFSLDLRWWSCCWRGSWIIFRMGRWCCQPGCGCSLGWNDKKKADGMKHFTSKGILKIVEESVRLGCKLKINVKWISTSPSFRISRNWILKKCISFISCYLQTKFRHVWKMTDDLLWLGLCFCPHVSLIQQTEERNRQF